MPADVAILIVAYHSAADLGPCLAAVAAQGVPAAVHVWNNSDENLRPVVRAHAGVVLHESPVNLGYCAANNRLLDATAAPFVLFLNPDTRLRPGCLATLLRVLRDAPAGVAAVGPKLVLPPEPGRPERLDSTGIELSRRNMSPHDRSHGLPDRGQYDRPESYFGPSLAGALWRRKAIENVKIFNQFLDERFFAYYEDVDVAWRARRLGWRFAYVPEAVCEHRRGHPTAHGPGLEARAFVNRYLTWIANEDGDEGWAYLWSALPRELARLAWKTIATPGFAVAWRMLAADWARARHKRRRLAAMANCSCRILR